MEHVTQTVGEAIAHSVERLRVSGSESARLDAEVLLGSVLGIDRSGIIAYPDIPLSPTQAAVFQSYLDRRCAGEPVAYIRGMREFGGVALRVDPRVLIPRPETETLVELAIERVRDALTSRPRPSGAAPFGVWDIGTGSGAIPVAMATQLRKLRYGEAVRYHLSDVSADALEVAKLNAVAHGVADLMTFALGDLAAVDARPAEPTDLLVSNLPYIPTRDLADLPVAIGFEPRLALDGGPDGLDIIRRLLRTLPGLLDDEGLALLEIGADQADAIWLAVNEALPDWHLSIHADLAGQARVAEVRRSGG